MCDDFQRQRRNERKGRRVHPTVAAAAAAERRRGAQSRVARGEALLGENVGAVAGEAPKTRARRGDHEGTGQPGRRRFGFRRRSTSRLGRKRGHSQVPRHARATTRRLGAAAHIARREPQFTATRKFQGHGGDAETGHRPGRHLRPGGARAGARAGQGQT